MTGKKRDKGDKAKALGKGLKTMFRTLEQRPVPQDIKSVVDQLDAAEPPPKIKR